MPSKNNQYIIPMVVNIMKAHICNSKYTMVIYFSASILDYNLDRPYLYMGIIYFLRLSSLDIISTVRISLRYVYHDSSNELMVFILLAQKT